MLREPLDVKERAAANYFESAIQYGVLTSFFMFHYHLETLFVSAPGGDRANTGRDLRLRFKRCLVFEGLGASLPLGAVKSLYCVDGATELL